MEIVKPNTAQYIKSKIRNCGWTFSIAAKHYALPESTIREIIAKSYKQQSPYYRQLLEIEKKNHQVNTEKKEDNHLSKLQIANELSSVLPLNDENWLVSNSDNTFATCDKEKANTTNKSNSKRVAVLETGYLINMVNLGLDLPTDYGVITLPRFCFAELLTISRDYTNPNSHTAKQAIKLLNSFGNRTKRYVPIYFKPIDRKFLPANCLIPPRIIRLASGISTLSEKWDITCFTATRSLKEWCDFHNIDVEILLDYNF